MHKLVRWSIVPSGVSSMQIEGYCMKTGQFVTTEDIQRRLGNNRVVSVGGVCYELVGLFNWNACFKSNIPSHILDSFKNGVPVYWKRIIHGWPPSAPRKRIRLSSKRKVKRPTSGRHGRLTVTPQVSVPGTPRNDHKLDGLRPSTQQRSLSRGAPGTEEERAVTQAERSVSSGNHVAEARNESQLRMKNVKVVLEPLPSFVSFKGYIEQSAKNKQICSTPFRSTLISAERRSTRSTSSRKASWNHKRSSSSIATLVVAGKSSSSREKENLMSMAEAETKVSIEETSGVGMVTRLRSASCTVLTQLEASCKAQAHVQSASIQQSRQEASQSKGVTQKINAESGTKVHCKNKKRKVSTTFRNLTMKTQQVHTSVPAATTAITRSSTSQRGTRRGSQWSAEQGCRKAEIKREKPKWGKGDSPRRADGTRKHRCMDPHADKQRGKAASLFSSPPHREKQSTSSFAYGCTRSGCHYAGEGTRSASSNSRLAHALLARRKLDLTSSLDSENGSRPTKDSCVSVPSSNTHAKLQKKAGCPKQYDLTKQQKHFAPHTIMNVERVALLRGKQNPQQSSSQHPYAGGQGGTRTKIQNIPATKQAATSSPERLPRNRMQSGIYPEAKAQNAEETANKRRGTIERRLTRSMSSADNAFSWEKKANDGERAKMKKDANNLSSCTGQTQRQPVKGKKGQKQNVSSVSCPSLHRKSPPKLESCKIRVQTSQPSHASNSTATEALLAIARKGTLEQKVQTSRNKGTEKRDTFTAQKAASEVQKPPVSAASKVGSSKAQASNLCVASTSAVKLRKANEVQTPPVLDVSNMADGQYPTRKARQSKARDDIANISHASGAAATHPPDALLPKIQNRAVKRKLRTSAEEPDSLTGRKKPKEDDKVQRSASPHAVKMGGPGLASKAGRSKKQAETSELSHTSKTAEPVLTAAVQKGASRRKARATGRNDAEERDTSINHARLEANEARKPPVPSRLCSTARGDFKLAQKAGSSNMPANISDFDMALGSAATNKPKEDNKGQKPLVLHRLCTTKIGDNQHSKVMQKARPSKTQADTVKVGRARRATATQPPEASLPKVRMAALKRKLATGAEEPDSLPGRKKPKENNKSAEKLNASTGRGKPKRVSKAQRPPPSGSPEIGDDQPLEPTPKEGPSKTASKLGQATRTAVATAAVQQGTVQRGPQTSMRNFTEKNNSSANQNKPGKADKIQTPLAGKMSDFKLAPQISSQTCAEASDLGQGSKSTATDQVLAITAQKGILKRTGRTSKTENVEQTNQGKPKEGCKVQKPAPSDAESARELAPQAGPSKTPASDVDQATRPKKGSKVQKPAISDAESALIPHPGPSKTPASDVGQATRPKKGSKVQKPAPSDAESGRELTPQAGPSKTPASDVGQATRPKKGSKVHKPAPLGAESARELISQAGPSKTQASDVGQASKPLADVRFTEALLAITARKGTKKRKAQVKKLAEALAARDECDDIYGPGGAPVDVVCDVFGQDPWAQMSDFRASSMGTPTPNSPHVSPGKSCFSFSSAQSGTMSVSPPFSNAVLLGITRKRAAAALLPSLTPKLVRDQRKHLSVKAVTKGLRVLEEKMEQDMINVNCAESNAEDSDTESSCSNKLPPLL